MSPIDSQIGIGVYSTTHAGTGGRIRGSPDDFQVTEVLSDAAQKMIMSGGDYAVYLLKKRGIDTSHALSDVRRRTGARLKALGLKDASAVTTQFVSASAKNVLVGGYDAGRYSLEPAGSSKRPLSKGDMAANRFAIRILGSHDAQSFCEHDRILNFYGYQRFGSKRPVTHLVGRAIVRRDFEGAVRTLVSFGLESEQEILDALASSDYARCRDLLPRAMDIERDVLAEMAKGDALRALRAAPIHMRRFYVQAYQSYIFNRSVSLAFSAGEDMFCATEGDVCYDPTGKIGKYLRGAGQRLAVPFVGYGYYKKTRFDRHISCVLEEEDVGPGDFFIKEFDEASSEGGFRQAAIRCENWSVREDTVQFDLSRGSFATMVLREVIKPDDPIAAGF